MTRRQGVIAMLGSIIALMTERSTKAENEVQNALTSGGGFSFSKGSIYFNLDSYISYEFHLGDKVVKLSPEEIMTALESKP